MRNNLKIETLRTGDEVPRVAILACLPNIQALMKSNPLVVFELIKLAQNPDHKMLDDTGEQAQEFALLKEDLTIDRTIKSILLSSVEVDGLAMRIVNPIHPNPASARRPTR